jgi:uncharacterized protein YbjT (DUF2867 family)
MLLSTPRIDCAVGSWPDAEGGGQPAAIRRGLTGRLFQTEHGIALVEPEPTRRWALGVLAEPGPHVGRIYELTGSRSEDMHEVAREYSDALNREVTYSDISPEDWDGS